MKTPAPKPPLVLIDGNNWMSRFFFGIKVNLTAQDGTPTAAVHGWMNNIWRVFDAYNPGRVVAVFDNGRCSYRTQILPEYKAQRTGSAEKDNLYRQIEHVKKMCPLIGIEVAAFPNVEADDVIYTLAKAHDGPVYIMSNDKDLMACVTDKVKIVRFTGDTSAPWQAFNALDVEQKMGVPPARIPELLALVGDSADNIPGVPGVGDKTAATWLRNHTIEQIIVSCPVTLVPERLRLAAYTNNAQLRKAYTVAQLRDINAAALNSHTAVPAINVVEALLMMNSLNLKQAAAKLTERERAGAKPFEK